MARWFRSLGPIAVATALFLCVAVLPAAAAEKVLVVATEGDVETLDPNFSRYPTANMANLNVYDQFFNYGRDDTGKGYFVTNVKKIEGAAIAKWEVAPDRMSVMLHVRLPHSWRPVSPQTAGHSCGLAHGSAPAPPHAVTHSYSLSPVSTRHARDA